MEEKENGTVTFELNSKQLEAYKSMPPVVNGKNQPLSIDEAAKEIFVQWIIQAKTQMITKELTK